MHNSVAISCFYYVNIGLASIILAGHNTQDLHVVKGHFVFIIESLDGGACLTQSTPVCDGSNNQHSNLCSFLRTREEFSYFGQCKVRYC